MEGLFDMCRSHEKAMDAKEWEITRLRALLRELVEAVEKVFGCFPMLEHSVTGDNIRFIKARAEAALKEERDGHEH